MNLNSKAIIKKMTFTMIVKFSLKLIDIILHFMVIMKFPPAALGLNLIINYLAYFHRFVNNSFIRPAANRRAETINPAIWVANSQNLVCSQDDPRTVHYLPLAPRFHPHLLLYLLGSPGICH